MTIDANSRRVGGAKRAIDASRAEDVEESRRPAKRARSAVQESLSGLQPRHAPSLATLGPRAALPGVTARPHAGARPESTAETTAGTPVEIVPLPPVPAVTIPRHLWSVARAKSRQRVAQPLCNAYNAEHRTKLKLSEFLAVALKGTGAPGTRAFETSEPNIKRFVVPIAGIRDPVQVLRRDEDNGSRLGDLQLIENASQDAIRAGIAEMRTSQSRVTSHRVLKAAGARKEHAPRVMSPRFKEAWKEFCDIKGNEGTSLAAFNALLLHWAETTATRLGKTALDGIERFGIQVPGRKEPIIAFGLLGANGKVVVVREVPEQKAHEGWALDELVKIRTNRAGTTQRVRSEHEVEVTHLHSIWSKVGKQLEADYARWRPQQKSVKEATKAAYVGALLTHCEQTRGEHVAKGISRHVLQTTSDGELLEILALKGNDGKATTLRTVDHVTPQKVALAALLNAQSVMAAHVKAHVETQATVQAASAADEAPTQTAELGRRNRRRPSDEVSDAGQIKDALALMAKNKSKGKFFLDGVERSSRLSEAGVLRVWFKPDGSVKTSSLPVWGKLRGFSEHRDQIHDLLMQLGQQEAADELPQLTSAALIARMLEVKLEARQANEFLSTGDLARKAKTHYIRASRSVGEDGALLINGELLRHYPDYEEHREEIARLLDGLGHAPQAKSLPRPPSASDTVLREISDNLYLLDAALRIQRSEPRLSLQEAAERIQAPVHLLEKMTAKGKVLSAEEIAGRLDEFDKALLPELEKLLQRLRVTSASPAGEEPTMTTRLLAAGNQGLVDRLFVVKGPRMLEATAARGLKEIYAHNTELVRKPRSFRKERGRQTLRWLATALKRRFPDAVEVQCYYDRSKKKIWASSNRSEVNDRLRSFLSPKSGELMAWLEQSSGKHDTRIGRHMGKLGRALKRPEQADKPGQILAAIAKGGFLVPDDVFYLDRRQVDLHAERRIMQAVRVEGPPLDPSLLAGTMRPCGICADEVGLSTAARRGPFWLSKPAQAFADTPKIVEENRQASIGTSVTETKSGALTLYHDTDSDSDIEEDVAGKEGAQPRKRRRDVDASHSGPATDIAALETTTREARHLMHALGIDLRGDAGATLQQEAQQALQQLLHEGKRRLEPIFGGDEASIEDKELLQNIGRHCASLRVFAEAMPTQGLPTAPLPPTVPQNGVWSAAQVDELFERGSASGQDNICWFHAVAQLAADPAADDRDRVVKETTQRLRRASDLLGFSRQGAMFDNSNDGGGVHLLAHMLGLQVHTFAHHQGRLYLQPQNTAGSPQARSVYLHLEGSHFIPLWPKPESGIERQRAGEGLDAGTRRPVSKQAAQPEPTLADMIKQLFRARRSKP
jgi:hypothetical protein